MTDLIQIKGKVKFKSDTFLEVQFLWKFDPNVFTRLIKKIRKEAGDNNFIFLPETKGWYINEDYFPLLFQTTKELKEIYGGGDDAANDLREALRNEG